MSHYERCILTNDVSLRAISLDEALLTLRPTTSLDERRLLMELSLLLDEQCLFTTDLSLLLAKLSLLLTHELSSQILDG